MPLLRHDDPALAYDGACDRARAILEAYEPRDADQVDAKACMLEFVSEHPRDAHLRECVPGHLTASAIIVHPGGGKGLFTHHAKLDRWLQLGGHCDGDGNLPAVALREAFEESGIRDLRIDPVPVDLDIHLIPERKGEPAHVHLDTRFRIHSPTADFTVSDESHDLAWLTLDELHERGDGSVLRLAALVLGTS